MNRPVVIVEPLSSGLELAPAFKARGIPAIAISVQPKDRIGFGTQIRASDFIEIIPDQPNIAEIIKQYNPLAIIPGTDSAVSLAEHLATLLTPKYTNVPEKSLHRQHKAFMQTALQEAGVAHLKTLNASSEQEITTWIKDNKLENSPLIVKPPLSAGSDNVFHIPVNGDWQQAFHKILKEPSKLTGIISKTVVIQEEAIGTEFAVGTVSANGKHYLAHLIKYNKMLFNSRKTVIDYVEFVPYSQELYGPLFSYTKQVLDALGVRWGAAHTEIMLTAQGPRLIELGARMCGGPVVSFARKASGSSQADKIVEAFVDGDVISKNYDFKTSVVPVFLKSPVAGTISNVEALAEVAELPTLLKEYIWLKNGDYVPQTVDYLTSIGIVALAGERELIFKDYNKIRQMEAKLIVNTN